VPLLTRHDEAAHAVQAVRPPPPAAVPAAALLPPPQLHFPPERKEKKRKNRRRHTPTEKIIAGGGFGKAQTPGEGDRTCKLHNGLSHFLTAHDDDAITFTGKDGKPPSAKTKLSDKKEAYFQPLIDGERHYSVLFGKTSTRRERLSQYGYKTNAKPPPPSSASAARLSSWARRHPRRRTRL
jgi:hypothetical protein